MGVHKNIGINKFTRQGERKGKNVKVYFNYDITQHVKGVCIRDDIEAPGLTIFKLDDERIVTSKECHYTMIKG